MTCSNLDKNIQKDIHQLRDMMRDLLKANSPNAKLLFCAAKCTQDTPTLEYLETELIAIKSDIEKKHDLNRKSGKQDDMDGDFNEQPKKKVDKDTEKTIRNQI